MLDKPDGSRASRSAGGTPAYPTDPIGAAAQVVTAYHETYPLTEAEVDVSLHVSRHPPLFQRLHRGAADARRS